jgi:hypothetical protein
VRAKSFAKNTTKNEYQHIVTLVLRAVLTLAPVRRTIRRHLVSGPLIQAVD